MDEFEVAILGGGIAGVSAAARAAELDAKVCLIEKGQLGGRCFHTGLYPYRSLMNRLEENGIRARSQDSMGLAAGKKVKDYSELFAETKRVSQSLAGRRESNLVESGVHIETGEGVLIGPNEIRVRGSGEEKCIKAQKIIMATGSDIAAPVTMPFDGERIIASDQAFKLGEAPDSVLILGGGAMGCELAVLFNQLGSKTFLCDAAPRLLPEQDPDVIEALEAEMKKQKVKLLLNKKVISIFKDSRAIDVSLEGGVKFSVQTIVLVSGRKPRTEGLESGKPGFRMGEKGQVLVDEKQESTLNGVYAVGSVTGRASFNGLSEEEGRVAAENALGGTARLNVDWIPRIVHTNPEIATVGCFARDAHHKGFRAVEGRCDNDRLDHSMMGRDDSGFVKIVADKPSKKIIGGQIVARRASEFIPLILLAIKKGLTIGSLAGLSCGSSTQFQGIREAAKACIQALRIRR